MKSVMAICIMSVGLTGCNYAARQALGDAATPINPTKGLQLEAGRIYRLQKNGTLTNLCKDDMNNRAIKAIEVRQTLDSNDTLTDEAPTDNITFAFPGIPTINMPYYKTRVRGYSVKRAYSPSDDDFVTYVRESVGKNCRKYLDDKNVLIVEAEARAKRSEQAFKGPVSQIPFGPGSVNIGGEWVKAAPQNVTFGVIAGRK